MVTKEMTAILKKYWFHIFAILIILVWGVSFPFTKILLANGLSPTEIFVYRFTDSCSAVIRKSGTGHILKKLPRDGWGAARCPG